jgi:hypothetical protein
MGDSKLIILRDHGKFIMRKHLFGKLPLTLRPLDHGSTTSLTLLLLDYQINSRPQHTVAGVSRIALPKANFV